MTKEEEKTLLEKYDCTIKEGAVHPNSLNSDVALCFKDLISCVWLYEYVCEEEKTVTVYEIDNTEDTQSIADHFEETCQSKIIWIDFVKNHTQLALFHLKRLEFEKLGHPTEMVDRGMFHGTSVCEIVAKSVNGVDIYWASAADHGFGSYFAFTAEYSAAYSWKTPGKIKQMLYC